MYKIEEMQNNDGILIREGCGEIATFDELTIQLLEDGIWVPKGTEANLKATGEAYLCV